jgi:outer membrane protein insertion porin family
MWGHARSFLQVRLKVAAIVTFAVPFQGTCFLQAQSSAQKQAPATASQVQEVLPSYEGQHVSAIEVAGRPNLDAKQFEALLVQKQGQPFEKAKVDQTIAALKRSGAAKEIELEVRPQPDGIRLLFVLQPAFYFGMYQFPGAERFGYSRLLQVANYPPRGAYASGDVEATQAALLQFFQQNGFFQAEIKPEIDVDSSHELVNVNFHVTLNRRAKFGRVIFSGAPPDQEQKLQRALKSWIARARGVAIRPGKNYSLKTIQNATQYLESQLIKQDYLGTRVELAGAQYDPKTRRADVHYEVTPGPRAHVKIEGAHVWSRTQHKLIPMYQQAGLDPELIQEGRQNLISYFQSKGYFNAQIQSELQQGKNEQTIFYHITKGPRHKVKEVDIAGNHKIPNDELRGHIAVQKAHFFSHGKFSTQLARKSADNLKRVYQAQGFSSVEITPEVTEANGNIVVKFRVVEGPQDIVESLTLNGNVTVPESTLAPSGLKVVEGQAYSTKRVDEDRNQIMAQYLRMGYLNANFRAMAQAVGKNSHRLAVTYLISEGPRVITKSVITLGARSTKQSLIDQTVRLKTETPLREDELLAAESRLYTLGILDWAQIDPRRQITTQTEEDVLVKVHESKENEIRYGFGFEVINRGGSIPSGTVALPGLPPVGLPSTFKTSEKTFWGPRGTFQYTRRNFRGLGETISLSFLGARLDQRASASYTDPYFLGANYSSNVLLTVERNSENPIFTSRSGDFGFQVERLLNATGTRRLTARYGYRQTALTNLLIPDLVSPEDLRVRLSYFDGTYTYDTRDNVLDAHKGTFQTAEFDIDPSAFGSSVNFARLRIQAAYYKNIGAGIIWANSLRLGMAQPFSGSRVPVSELFFSGGGSTLRGFPLNGAGPQHSVPVCGNPADPSTCAQITVPQGGRELFIANSEVRIPVPLKKGLGVAAFYDGGNVFQHVGFNDFGSNYTNTVGIGLRYSTPVGPVRIDLGHNLNSLPGIKSTQFFITLGQAF